MVVHQIRNELSSLSWITLAFVGLSLFLLKLIDWFFICLIILLILLLKFLTSDTVPTNEPVNRTVKDGSRLVDVLTEKLVQQIWEKYQAEIRKDECFHGVSLEPLFLDAFIPEGKKYFDINSAYYGAKLSLWDMKIYGLSTVRLSETLILRANDLSDIDMRIKFHIWSLSARGTYDLDGWMSLLTVNSGGPQLFDVTMDNVSIIVNIKLEDSCSEKDALVKRKKVVSVTKLELTLSYARMNIQFDNIGVVYNKLLNWISDYLIKQAEEAIVEAAKEELGKHFHIAIS